MPVTQDGDAAASAQALDNNHNVNVKDVAHQDQATVASSTASSSSSSRLSILLEKNRRIMAANGFAAQRAFGIVMLVGICTLTLKTGLNPTLTYGLMLFFGPLLYIGIWQTHYMLMTTAVAEEKESKMTEIFYIFGVPNSLYLFSWLCALGTFAVFETCLILLIDNYYLHIFDESSQWLWAAFFGVAFLQAYNMGIFIAMWTTLQQNAAMSAIGFYFVVYSLTFWLTQNSTKIPFFIEDTEANDELRRSVAGWVIGALHFIPFVAIIMVLFSSVNEFKGIKELRTLATLQGNYASGRGAVRSGVLVKRVQDWVCTYLASANPAEEKALR